MVKHHVKRQMKSYKYAAKGVHYTLATQVNIWVQLFATVIVLLTAYYLDFSLEHYLILVLTIGFVIAAELFNTAIEILVDLISPEHHPQAGLIKDVAAGAVLVASFTAAIIGTVLFVTAIAYKFSL